MNFGSGYNYIAIDSNTAFNNINDSLAFSEPIRMIGITRDDVISNTDSLVINWTGASAANIVKVELSINNSIKDSEKDDVTDLVLYINNAGSFKFLPTDLLLFEAGVYVDIVVSAIEVQYLTVSSGKSIAVLGISSHRITIKLSN